MTIYRVPVGLKFTRECEIVGHAQTFAAADAIVQEQSLDGFGYYLYHNPTEIWAWDPSFWTAEEIAMLGPVHGWVRSSR